MSVVLRIETPKKKIFQRIRMPGSCSHLQLPLRRRDKNATLRGRHVHYAATALRVYIQVVDALVVHVTNDLNIVKLRRLLL